MRQKRCPGTRQVFHGTCYQAANWVRIGQTRGRGKYDRHNECAQPVKAVYLRPLKKNYREFLYA